MGWTFTGWEGTQWMYFLSSKAAAQHSGWSQELSLTQIDFPYEQQGGWVDLVEVGVAALFVKE